jgi:hypothetical protein
MSTGLKGSLDQPDSNKHPIPTGATGGGDEDLGEAVAEEGDMRWSCHGCFSCELLSQREI